MNQHFQITYAHLDQFRGVREDHIGQWAIKNTPDSLMIFTSEADAKLANDFILLKPLMAA